jgi:4-hydroxyphenylpyruvate dioxygenase
MRIDHIHFYVENAVLWRDWFIYHLGFQLLTTDTPSFHTCTEAVTSGSIKFLFSSPILPTSPVAKFLTQHPPGVADVAFVVEDIATTIKLAQAAGSKIIRPIQQFQQDDQYYQWGKIAGWGSLAHTLIEISDGNTPIAIPYEGLYAAKYENDFPPFPILQTDKSMDSTAGLNAIDHVVLNVEAGNLQSAVTWYQKIFNLQPQQKFSIQTNYSALHSQVLVSPQGNVQLPINQPTTPTSQIQEFLDFNRGAGVQHIALRTSNLVKAIAQFRHRGLSFLTPPPTYYSQLQQRPGFSLTPEELQAIATQQILVDWHPETPQALLLQIFTRHIFAQPTFFLELIERRFQAPGFGERNFQALFAAMEAEQIQRGSLRVSQ